MGQLITVVEKPTARPDAVRFELNRSLTGMSHERYANAALATGPRPVDELARRLFAHGGVAGVHAYSNVVTVELAPGASGEGLAEVIHRLFEVYPPGSAPPGVVDPAAPPAV